MFSDIISDTPFTSTNADEFYQNISGEGFASDKSFHATLRALLHSRIPEGEFVFLKFSSTSYSVRMITENRASDVVRAIMNRLGGGEFVLNIHSLGGGAENRAATREVIKKHFTICYPEYYCVDKVEAFFRKSFPALCYINPHNKNVVFFVDDLDVKKLHYLQTAIPPALPWYFNPQNGASDLELELIRSLKEDSAEKYLSCLNRLAVQYDLRSGLIKSRLSGFEHSCERAACEKLKDKISRITDEIKQNNAKIAKFLRTKDDLCIELLGLQAKISQDSENSELMEYFLCNRQLHLGSVTQERLTFYVGSYASYFDKEIAERVLNNKKSFVYSQYASDHSSAFRPEQAEALLRAVFLDETIKLRVSAAYSLELREAVSPVQHANFPRELSDFMPNPHINRYGCMGSYTTIINEMLLEHNYVGALEQCVASCKSLNWSDSTVMQEFIFQLYGAIAGKSNIRCFELPDGSVISPWEAVEWVCEQKSGHKTETQEETYE